MTLIKLSLECMTLIVENFIATKTFIQTDGQTEIETKRTSTAVYEGKVINISLKREYHKMFWYIKSIKPTALSMLTHPIAMDYET